MYLTDDDIDAFATAAGAAGDFDAVAICLCATGRHRSVEVAGRRYDRDAARLEVAAMIADAQAQID